MSPDRGELPVNGVAPHPLVPLMEVPVLRSRGSEKKKKKTKGLFAIEAWRSPCTGGLEGLLGSDLSHRWDSIRKNAGPPWKGDEE